MPRPSALLALVLLTGCSDQKLAALEPIVSVHPEEVVFSDLVLGEPATARVQVGNAGRAPLDVERVVVEPPFALSWSEGVIEPGAVAAVDLTFTPEEEADLNALLTVLSNDPDTPIWDVPVRAAPRAPRVTADPAAIVWEDSLTGGTESLVVSNEGEGPLRILGLSVASDGGGVFSLGLSALPSLMGAGDDSILDVSAAPSDLATGMLRILSNDPITPVLDIPLQIGASVQACPDLAYPEDTVDIDDTCEFAGLPPTWDPVVEATWRTFPTWPGSQAASQATVGRITDDNGDGVVDADDPPDLCIITPATDVPDFVAERTGVLRVLDSVGIVEHWSVNTFSWAGETWAIHINGTCALGDIDHDGEAEVVTPVKLPDTSAYGVVAFDDTGAVEWLTEMSFPGSALGEPWRWSSAPALADLEGDGDVEVVVGRTIFDGTSGALEAYGAVQNIGTSEFYINAGPKSFPADLDGDGVMEVVSGPSLLAPDGSILCEAPTATAIRPWPTSTATAWERWSSAAPRRSA